MARKKKAPAKKKPAANKKAGRPPLELTEEKQKRFLRAIQLGCPIKDACGCAGFSVSWFLECKAKVLSNPRAASSRAFVGFLDRIKEAEGEATARWLAAIEKAAADGAWQAAAWKLERRRGMSVKIKQELTGKDGEAIKFESESELDQALSKDETRAQTVALAKSLSDRVIH